MKTIASFANGALSITEDKGVFSFSVDESLSVGGGKAAGVIKIAGKGSVQLDGMMALKLGEALVNSKLPAAVEPAAEALEAVANSAISALE